MLTKIQQENTNVYRIEKFIELKNLSKSLSSFIVKRLYHEKNQEEEMMISSEVKMINH